MRVVADDVTAALGGLALNGHAAPLTPTPQPSPPPPLVAMDATLAALREVIVWPSTHAAPAAALGVVWPRGVLLVGPPGVGKTAAVTTVAAEAGAPVVTLAPGTAFGAHLGESEARVRAAFRGAARAARRGKSGRAVLLLDDVDALAPSRSSSGRHEARVVGQLLTLLDGAAGEGGRAPDGGPAVVVVATTSRPAALDSALRRAGRLDREVTVPLPSPAARGAILAVHTASLPLAPDVDVAAVGAAARGCSGADLAALARTAARAALADAAAAPPHTPPRLITAADFEAALAVTVPTVARGLATDAGAASARWSDVGGLTTVKNQLRCLIELPLTRPDACARLGYRPPRGILLHGPPGCSKSTLAAAVAAAVRASLHPLPAASLFSAYVGEGEAELRAVFAAARAAAPAVVFLDEADAVAASRSAASSAGASPAGARMLATLLAEMDGLAPADGVLILAATNRPWALDAALLRPGRLDAHVLVPPPDTPGLAAALAIHAAGCPLADDVDLDSVAASMRGATGADAAMIVREAALSAARRRGTTVTAADFDAALSGWAPSVTEDDVAAYERWQTERRGGF